MGWITNVLSAVLAWILAEVLYIIVFILDGLINIIVAFLSFLAIWMMHQLNEGAAEWLNFPVIVTFFEICRVIGIALFIAGVMYSLCENMINYNNGQGLSAFRTTFLNIIKAFAAVSLFTVVPLSCSAGL